MPTNKLKMVVSFQFHHYTLLTTLYTVTNDYTTTHYIWLDYTP
ncbi:MAG: hypothetical protein BSOLF_2727 [Candidatus Carbobacillus altaicus]|uniref:Uncharacterized protein n=1 Tax=Candidatus Carbonibacillus altaicus TaxID=2163959 RepID=A0A2R6Y242_9BACL|nr:MAG: hypothetical protein BSOLF_2727 [Candidatus Carbobacillus altaicus]